MTYGQVNLNLAPSRIIGQAQLTLVSTSPNLVEGREMFSPASVAVDTSTSPSILYVADLGNNRVLAWRNAAGFQNGDPADAVIGQRDRFTTLPAGPGTGLSTGFNAPVAVAVDSQGNLYVADAGNNRILRFPRPLAQQDALKLPDMVIGQQNFNGSTANQGGISAQSVALNLGSNRLFRSGMVFDSSGNLWFSDAGNNRVLRYPAAALQRGQNQPAADAVLGQFAFNTSVGNATGDPRVKTAMTQPSGLAIDPVGRLYVCDGLNRVLVFVSPGTGVPAARVMGVVVVAQGQPVPPAVNETSLGRTNAGGVVGSPEGVFFAGGTPFVLDTGANRIVRYDPFESWPSEATAFSPPGRQVIGQPDFTSFRPDRGNTEPNNAGFNQPVAAFVANNEVFVADGTNNRVLVFPLQGGTISTATRVAGQPEFYQGQPNTIDGRELFVFAGLTNLPSGGSVSDGAGIVIDSRSTPPRLYIADTYNHRILGFRDARSAKQGDRADIVIGQRDFTRALVNDPANDSNQLTDSGLSLPAGLAVDAAGNLYVADSGNGRVLRFPRPFEQAGRIRPDLSIGQSSFFNKITDATARTMSRPFGVAFTVDGHLLVSDAFHNRVLLFRKPAGGDFTTGQAADRVIGQPDFSTTSASTLPNRMVSPRHISTDTDDRLYVCDPGNGRVVIFDRITVADNDPTPALTIPGLSSPHGVWVSPNTGEIWITNTAVGTVLRFPKFIDIVLAGARPNYQIPINGGPLAVTQDAVGNLLVLETTNRLSMYFPGLNRTNAANGLARFAPGMYSTIKPVDGANFGDTTLIFDQIPNPIPMTTTLADIQVLVNDVPSPIHFVSPGQINFIIPQATPLTTVDVLVVRRSTGQILATSALQITSVAPAFFTTSGDGNGQVAAVNQDGTVNSPANAVARSGVVSLFGTGVGLVPGLPPDGEPVPGALPTNSEIRVAVGTAFLPDANILYSGMAPTLISVWQLTIRIPDTVAPGPQVVVAATVNSVPSNQDSAGRRVNTTIAVKP